MADPRVCVFCGAATDKKTKEHIFPQWLLRKTGNVNEPVRLGFDYRSTPPKMRRFPFSQVVLPAYEACNQRYSILEKRAGISMRKVLDRLPLHPEDVEVLMDWFDKVRVGVWLWELKFNRHKIAPKFFVDRRLSSKDRSLLIIKLKPDLSGLGFIGTSTEAFLKSPSCFGMLINNTAFINVSYDFLYSYRLGFPYATNWQSGGPGKPDYAELQLGRSEISSPLFPDHFKVPGCLFAQCVYKEILAYENAHDYYNNDYVRSLTIDKKDRSNIFVEEHGNVRPFSKDDPLVHNWISHSDVYEREEAFCIQLEVLKIQKSLLFIAPHLQGGSMHPETRVRQRTLQELNLMIDHLRIMEENTGRTSGKLIYPS